MLSRDLFFPCRRVLDLLDFPCQSSVPNHPLLPGVKLSEAMSIACMAAEPRNPCNLWVVKLAANNMSIHEYFIQVLE